MKNLTKLKEVTEEILGEEELISLIKNGEELNHYIGFEISGLVHLGSGLITGIVLRELQNIGVNTSLLLADWHSWINNKLQGDREFILQTAKEYFSEALLVSAKIAGADPSKILIRYGSEAYHNNDRFWESVIDVSKQLTLSRVIKSTAIMGRESSSSMEFAQLIYPPMQVADIFEFGVNVAHSGTDQRKVHVIAREVASKLNVNPLTDSKGKVIKPIGIHHHLLLGLQKPKTWPIKDESDKDFIRTNMKMSKSIPGSAIYIHDSEDEIRDKVRKAFSPEKEVIFNPVLDWTKNIIFNITGELTVKREERHGGNFTAKSFKEIEERYSSGELFSLDLKNAVADVLIDILTPARKAFKDKEEIIKKIIEKQSR